MAATIRSRTGFVLNQPLAKPGFNRSIVSSTSLGMARMRFT